MSEKVNNLFNFWKTHNIGEGLFNSSVGYSYPPVDNAFTTSSGREISITEKETVFAGPTSTPAQTLNTDPIVKYRIKAYELNGLKGEIEKLETNNNLSQSKKQELTQLKRKYNKGVKDLRGMYSESFKERIPEQINFDKYQELEVKKQKQSNNVKKKKTQTSTTSAKKVSQQNKQPELNFGDSEITTNPAPNKNTQTSATSAKKVSPQYQQLECDFGDSEITTNPAPNKNTQTSATSAKKVSPQYQQLECDFGDSEITTNPTSNSKVEAEKAEKPPKSKTKSTKKGKQSKFFKGKKGRFGAILAGIALVGAAIAYVEDKASDKVEKASDKVEKAQDVKAEQPVENTTPIEEVSETVEPIQVAPENVPVQEEIDPDVVTVKSGDTVWDLCEQKLKEWGNENPTAKQIRELVDKVMADEKNHLYCENDNYTVIIKPEQKIWICKPEEENL